MASIQTTEAFIDRLNYLLDEKNLEFILLGNIQSDLERRFSWYRQSSGGNYHISVLQILQSEKTIRVRSLVEQDFHMKEIQNIFTSIDDSEKTDADAHLSELITFQIDSFRFHSAVDQNDTSIIFYVAGAVSRTLLKKNKC